MRKQRFYSDSVPSLTTNYENPLEKRCRPRSRINVGVVSGAIGTASEFFSVRSSDGLVAASVVEAAPYHAPPAYSRFRLMKAQHTRRGSFSFNLGKTINLVTVSADLNVGS